MMVGVLHTSCHFCIASILNFSPKKKVETRFAKKKQRKIMCFVFCLSSCFSYFYCCCIFSAFFPLSIVFACLLFVHVLVSALRLSTSRHGDIHTHHTIQTHGSSPGDAVCERRFTWTHTERETLKRNQPLSTTITHTLHTSLKTTTTVSSNQLNKKDKAMFRKSTLICLGVAMFAASAASQTVSIATASQHFAKNKISHGKTPKTTKSCLPTRPT